MISTDIKLLFSLYWKHFTHIFLILTASLRDKDIYLYHEYTETERAFTAEAQYGRHRSKFRAQKT